MGIRVARRARARNRALAWLTAGALVLAACGGDDDDSSSPAPSPVGTSAPSDGGDTDGGAPSGGQIDRSATLRVGMNFMGISWFDPKLDNGTTVSKAWNDLIFGTMIHEVGQNEIEPGLATEWSAPDDYTVELTLREGVTFTDGTPFDAEAVKFSWERCRDEAAFLMQLFASLKEVEVVDPLHVRVHLDMPFAGVWLSYFLRTSIYCMAIVSPTAVEKYGDDFDKNPVGAGPYALSNFQPDQMIELTAREGYYDPDLQVSPKIQFVQVAAGAAAVTAVASGEVDIYRVSLAEYDAAKAAGLEAITQEGDIVTLLAMCSTKPPFDQVDARRAVALAIDREEINDLVTRGNAKPWAALFPEWHPYYSSDGLDLLERDIEQAKALAESSGLSGQTVDLMFNSSAPTQAATAEILQSQLSEIGLTLNLIPSMNIYADKNAQNPQMDLHGMFPEMVDTMLYPGQINNHCGHDFPEINSAIDDLFVADETTARAAADQLQRAVAENAPQVMLYQDARVAIFKPGRIVADDLYMPSLGAFNYTTFGIAAD